MGILAQDLKSSADYVRVGTFVVVSESLSLTQPFTLVQSGFQSDVQIHSSWLFVDADRHGDNSGPEGNTLVLSALLYF